MTEVKVNTITHCGGGHGGRGLKGSTEKPLSDLEIVQKALDEMEDSCILIFRPGCKNHYIRDTKELLAWAKQQIGE